MARVRQIKPEFFMDEELGALPPATRLLFIGLWTIADKAGRLEDRPARIKAHLLPYDKDVTEEMVDSMIESLAGGRFVIRYSVDGKELLQIRSFDKHQHCHIHEQDSKLPGPEKSVQTPGGNGAPTTVSEGSTSQMHDASTRRAPDLHRTSTHTSTSASTSTNASTSASGKNSVQDGSKTEPPEPARPQARPERPKDEAYELWASEFLEHRKVPYQKKRADFVKLSEIRKAFGLNGKGMPTGWVEAIHNYFSSPLSSYTLADLCTRYDVFIRSPVNQYGRPLPHDDHHQRNQATFKAFTERRVFGDR